MPGEAGRAAAARADRTQATTPMSARAARWRTRLWPTLLLAPVIAMFTCLPMCPSDAAWLHPVRTRVPVSRLVDGRAQMKAAPRLRAFRVGRGSGIVGLLAVYLQFLHSRRPGTVQFGLVGHLCEDHRIHATVDAQASVFVLFHVPAPELALTSAATEIELAVRRRHAVQIHRVGHDAGIDLNLAQRDVVDETPVGYGRCLHVAQQHESGRPVARTGRGPDSDASHDHDDEHGEAQKKFSRASRSSTYRCLSHLERTC